jgi:adenylate cyclase
LLARTHTSAWSQPLDGDYLNPVALDRAHDLALRALRVDPNLPQAHAALGAALLWKAQHDASIAAFERARALNPNFTDWRFAAALVYAGEFSRAIDAARLHMRSDPFYEPIAPAWIGLAHYMMKNYQEAIPYLRETASRAPNARAGHLWLAATYARLSWSTEARLEASEVMRFEPKWTIEGTSKLVNRFKFPEHSEHFFDGRRKAGLPE